MMELPGILKEQIFSELIERLNFCVQSKINTKRHLYSCKLTKFWLSFLLEENLIILLF